MRTRSFRFAVLALTLVSICAPPGCAAVGPTAKQTREGQDIANSPTNKVTQTDNQGTITADVGGPTDWIRQDSSTTLSHTTGQVTRTIAAERPDGTRFTLRSGSDFEASDVRVNPATGEVTVGHFATSSSAPLTALGDLQSKFQETIKQIATDQRLSYADAYATVSKSIEALQPSIAALIKGAFGIP